MPTYSGKSERASMALVAAAFAVAGLCLAVAIVLTADALDQRRAAAEAADLEFAALAVSSTAIGTVGVGATQPTSHAALYEAFEVINDDSSTALRSLALSDRRRAEYLLGLLSPCVLERLTVTCGRFSTQQHEELQWLLVLASQNARSSARAAETRAVAGALLGSAALAVAGWSLMRTRARSRRDRADAAGARRLQALLHDSPDMFIVINPDGRLAYRSPSSQRLIGPVANWIASIIRCAKAEDRDLLRSHLRSRNAEHDVVTLHLTAFDGSTGWYELRVSDLTEDKNLGGHVLTIHDVSAEVALLEDLRRQALTDVLTGLPNRRALDDLITEAANDLDGSAESMAVVVLDLDGFKQINDSLGHPAGDVILGLVARRLSRTVGDAGHVARVGGDEFVVLYPSVSSAHEAERRARALRDVLDSPFTVHGRAERLRTSVGVGITSDPSRADGVLSEADMAMYEGKRSGGHQVVMFTPQMRPAILSTSRLSRALRAAVYDDEFRLEYQPIVQMSDGSVMAFEALLRWESPLMGEVSPQVFIPAAELSGQISGIGRWVFSEVCHQIRAWDTAGLASHIKVSVNVSARELANPDFVESILSTTTGWDVDPSRIIIEVTESSVLDDTELANARLGALRSVGFTIAIDDFGSGYSNLGQLLNVPFDIIKIDRSLLLMLSDMQTRTMGDAGQRCAIIEAVVSIANVLGAVALCEGVENEVQLELLRKSGISLVQGYLLGRPMPPEEIELTALTRSLAG